MKNGVNTDAGRPEFQAAFHNAEAGFPNQPSRPADPPSEERGRELVTKEVLTKISSHIFSKLAKIRQAMEQQREDRAWIQSLERQAREHKDELLALRDRNQSLQETAQRAEELAEREKRLQEQVLRIKKELAEKTSGLIETQQALDATQAEMKQAGLREASLSEDLKKQSLMLEETTHALFEREANLGKAFGVLQKVESTMAEIAPSDKEEDSPAAAGEQPDGASQTDDVVHEADAVRHNEKGAHPV